MNKEKLQKFTIVLFGIHYVWTIILAIFSGQAGLIAGAIFLPVILQLYFAFKALTFGVNAYGILSLVVILFAMLTYFAKED